MAQTKQFSFKEAIKLGWDLTTKNFVFLLVTMIIMAIFSGIGNIITPEAIKADPSLWLANLILAAISTFLTIWLNLGAIKAMLDLIDGKKPTYKGLFSQGDKIIKMFLSSLVYGLIVIGGIILFIVPGIIWSLKFCLYRYYIVEKNAGPIEALKMSAKAMSGAKWNVFLFNFVLGGVNLLGLLCLGVGLLITVPLTWIAMVSVYRKLDAQVNTIPAPAAPAPTTTA
jgi:uncharacterized membrane protein